MVIYPVESKCKAEFITDEAITECVGLCVSGRMTLWCCKHCANLRAYWLLSNYAEMQRRI